MVVALQPVSLTIDLYDTILPADSTYKVLGTKIELKLKKETTGNWPDLTNTGAQRLTAASVSASTGATPYASRRDWSQV